MKLCDIHTHILPCVDDGARSFEYARKMLKNAYAGKVEHLVATPHYIVYENKDGLEATILKDFSLVPQLAGCKEKYENEFYIINISIQPFFSITLPF
jgi:tyrosine-protein phosphatase YwqE